MIYVKTVAGQQVLRDRSVALTPRQRSAFVLFDGHRSEQDVLTSIHGLGQLEIASMVTLGLLTPSAVAPLPESRSGRSVPFTAAATDAVPERKAEHPAAALSDRTPQQRYQDAYPVATQLTASLGLRGFRLNLAVEAASSYEALLALTPRIREAVGAAACARLERALQD